MTYPLYLIHADIDFWSHAIFERKLWWQYPATKDLIGYNSTIVIAIVASFSISAIYIKFFDRPVNKFFNKIWSLPAHFVKANSVRE